MASRAVVRRAVSLIWAPSFRFFTAWAADTAGMMEAVRGTMKEEGRLYRVAAWSNTPLRERASSRVKPAPSWSRP